MGVGKTFIGAGISATIHVRTILTMTTFRRNFLYPAWRSVRFHPPFRSARPYARSAFSSQTLPWPTAAKTKFAPCPEDSTHADGYPPD
jgi:hypothetical protein